MNILFNNSCSFIYLNCRANQINKSNAKQTKKEQFSNIRFGFGPESLKPLSKNFFLSLNDFSESAIEISS